MRTVGNVWFTSGRTSYCNGIVWQEFVEVTRVLGLEVEQNIFEHLKQTEKDPDPTFIHSFDENTKH